jgi:hypothetical protein
VQECGGRTATPATPRRHGKVANAFLLARIKLVTAGQAIINTRLDKRIA